MSELDWIAFEQDGGNLKIKSTISGKKVMHELKKFMEKSKSIDTL